MKKSKPTPEIKIVKKKVIPRMSDAEIKAKKTHELLKMLESYSDLKLTFWEDNSGKGDIIGVMPIAKTTVKTIGGMFNPLEVRKDETFTKFFIIDIISSLKDSLVTKDDEKKKNFIEQRGMIYLRGFNINQIFDSVVNNQ